MHYVSENQINFSEMLKILKHLSERELAEDISIRGLFSQADLSKAEMRWLASQGLVKDIYCNTEEQYDVMRRCHRVEEVFIKIDPDSLSLAIEKIENHMAGMERYSSPALE